MYKCIQNDKLTNNCAQLRNRRRKKDYLALMDAFGPATREKEGVGGKRREIDRCFCEM